MAFLEIVRKILKSSGDTTRQAELTQRAEELRDALAEDPNDVSAFEELAGLIRDAGAGVEREDPLTADSEETTDRTPELALWALGEEIGSDSRAWYPLIQLARLSVEGDHDAALHRLETAADRDETGLALAEGVKVLHEAGADESALSLGLGRWNPNTHTHSVGECLIEAALAAKKPKQAARFLEQLKEVNAPEDFIDEMSVRIATFEE